MWTSEKARGKTEVTCFPVPPGDKTGWSLSKSLCLLSRRRDVTVTLTLTGCWVWSHWGCVAFTYINIWTSYINKLTSQWDINNSNLSVTYIRLTHHLNLREWKNSSVVHRKFDFLLFPLQTHLDEREYTQQWSMTEGYIRKHWKDDTLKSDMTSTLNYRIMVDSANMHFLFGGSDEPRTKSQQCHSDTNTPEHTTIQRSGFWPYLCRSGKPQRELHWKDKGWSQEEVKKKRRSRWLYGV